MAAERRFHRCSWRQLLDIALSLLVLAASASPYVAAVAESPPLLLAERYRDDIDVSRYRGSERLEGVRAVWDSKVLRFRIGNPVPAPPWFVEALLRQPLDGELWLGRGNFDRLRRSFAASHPTMANGDAYPT